MRRSLILTYFFPFFPSLFCALPLPCPCLVRCLIYCLTVGSRGLIFFVITDSYDCYACLSGNLYHCLAFEAFPKPLDPGFVAVQTGGHVALRHGELPALKLDRPLFVSDPRRLPCGAYDEPRECQRLGIVAERGVADQGAMNADVPAHSRLTTTRPPLMGSANW